MKPTIGMINTAMETVKRSAQGLWIKACIYDAIDPYSTFISFSRGNPWARKFNIVAREYLALVDQKESLETKIK